MRADKYFSPYAPDHDQAHRRGSHEFGHWSFWRPVLQMWCTTILVLMLGAAVTEAARNAEAKSYFMQFHHH